MSIMQLSPTSVGISMEFMRRKAPELAADIVCQLDGAANLAATYGLTEVQWSVLKIWPSFQQLVKDANEELGGSAGTHERARRKAALAVAEMGVQDMATIMGDPKATPRDRIAAFSELKEVGMMGAKAQSAAAAGAVVGGFGGPLIQIIMPNGAKLNVGEVGVDEERAALEGEFTTLEKTA